MREEIIGKARLILGDCRDVLPTLERFDLVCTDPPYGIDYQSTLGNLGAQEFSKIANDDGSLDFVLFLVGHGRFLWLGGHCPLDAQSLGQTPKPVNP